MPALTVEDRLDILDVIARFGVVHDLRQPDLFLEVFTEDAQVDFSYVGGRASMDLGQYRALLQGMVKSGFHADHQTTDTIVIAEGPDGARARSRYMVIRPDGSMSNGEILDRLRRTERGWRIAERRMIRRWPASDKGPPPASYYSGWPLAGGEEGNKPA